MPGEVYYDSNKQMRETKPYPKSIPSYYDDSYFYCNY